MSYDDLYRNTVGLATTTIIISLVVSVVVCIVFIVICGAIAKSKGLPRSYKWFGLLGIIGLIIVAVSSPRNNVPPYTQNGYYYPYQNQQPPQQYPPQQYPPYQQQNTQYQQPPQQAPQPPATKFCPTCGRQVDASAKICPYCSRAV